MYPSEQPAAADALQPPLRYGFQARLSRRVRCQKEGNNIARDYVGQKIADILKRKKASIKQARLPPGSPAWDAFMEMTWEQIEVGARVNSPGFKVVRKLLTDKRFDK